MEIVFYIIPLLILGVWVASSLGLIFSQRGFTFKSILNFVAGVCMIWGIVGFISPFQLLGSNFKIPSDFEWPITYSSSALETEEGLFVIPNEPFGRIQVYDQSLQFLYGWNVDTGGGSFRMFPKGEDSVEIYTARGDMKFHYSLDGFLLSSEEFSRPYPAPYSDAVSVSIKTPIYLWVFTHPFKAWIVAALGMGLAYLANKLGGKKDIDIAD